MSASRRRQPASVARLFHGRSRELRYRRRARSAANRFTIRQRAPAPRRCPRRRPDWHGPSALVLSPRAVTHAAPATRGKNDASRCASRGDGCRPAGSAPRPGRPRRLRTRGRTDRPDTGRVVLTEKRARCVIVRPTRVRAKIHVLPRSRSAELLDTSDALTGSTPPASGGEPRPLCGLKPGRLGSRCCIPLTAPAPHLKRLSEAVRFRD